MTQQLAVHKDIQQAHDALWWNPIFSIQQDVNRTLKEVLSRTIKDSFVPSSFWDMEEEAFTSTQRGVHRLFSELFNNRQMATPWLTGTNTEPYINIIENGSSFKVMADVPGVKLEDMDVSIAENALTISGKRCEEKKEDGDNYIRRECCYGEFSRTIALPEEADMDKASASFEQNILTVKIPKKAEKAAKGRTLQIKEIKDAVTKPSSKKSEKSESKKQKKTETAAKSEPNYEQQRSVQTAESTTRSFSTNTSSLDEPQAA